MPVKLRPYQQQLDAETNAAWDAGHVDVGVNSATGSGKTVFFSHVIQQHRGGSVAVAHRQELVSQISVALARNEVRHRIIGAVAVTRNIVSMHMADGGRSYYDANARSAAAGVDTLVRMPDNDPLFGQTTRLVMDEGHHVLRANKWGKARNKFVHQDLRALHVSATWLRADGQGHGRHADGFIDTLINAPSMRAQINAGYLTGYRVVSVQASDLDLTGVERGADGDFNAFQLREAVHKSSRLVGDVVNEYLKWARGKLGVTFAVDVEDATKIAVAFRAAGVPAEVVSAKTPDHLRMSILRRFRRREILQLVNVDLFGEGFDLPAIEVITFARPTESWALYCQQFGRVLRLMLDPSLYPIWDALTDGERLAYIAASDKPYGRIIDHVGNVIRHFGPPDNRVTFSLDRREKRSSSSVTDAIPYRVCVNPRVAATGLPCAQPYERFHKKCPHCGHYPEPTLRSGPEYVDGDLVELDAETLAAIREDIARVDGAAVVPYGQTQIVQMAVRKHHDAKQQAQQKLRNTMAWWSGLQDALGNPALEEKYRRFYLMFGIDTATAQTLNAADAEKLRLKIYNVLLRYNVDGVVNMQ